MAPDVKITAAHAATSPVPLCKIDGVIGKEINFSVWLPDAWNGKFVMGGQGGFAGRVESQAMSMQRAAEGLCDGRHRHRALLARRAASMARGRWATMERIVNYAHAAIHRVTATSKSIVQCALWPRAGANRISPAARMAGGEALQAAQRYPNDFDGIIAGAPAIDFQGITAAFSTITQKMYPDPKKLDAPVLDKPAREILSPRPCSTSAMRSTG